ncbi:MAG: UvrD-helicase domain-containing protein, partial [Verrucomicrobia bacterium]|nr:UvrD-helicase domain-containing protein [Verrucomicrobiota bacterium]
MKARGNVIVVAGAGTGKTSTLVERCLGVISDPTASSLDRVLMVTFTDAAAAEMRHRLRHALQAFVDRSAGAVKEHAASQLALVETAKISTIHSFCLRLVQSHFHELGLDPEVRVLDDQQCRLLTQETLDDLFEECFSGKIEISDAVQALVEAYAPDRDGRIRDLVLRLHRYTQSRPDAESWLAEQREACAAETPGRWEHWLEEAFAGWRDEWRRALEL